MIEKVPERLGGIFGQMIQEICVEENLNLEWLSNYWIAKISDQSQFHYIVGQDFELNSATANTIANDKYATHAVLKSAKLPVIQHTLCYSSANEREFAAGRNSLAFVEDFFDRNQSKIVIKNNRGSSGNEVFLVSERAEIPRVLAQVFSRADSASLCPFYEFELEYRTVWLNGAVRLIYSKQCQDDWRCNLAHGSVAREVKDANLARQLSILAEKAARAIGLNFCTVDIIKTERELLILEVNPGVMLSGFVTQNPQRYDFVKQIYHDAVRNTFGKPRLM